MKTVGTREAKDIIYMNNGIRIGDMVCRVHKNGYKITQGDKDIMKVKKLDLALDWMVENEYLVETRLRLTANQKNILRSRIWEFVGCTVMGGFSLGVALILIIAWICGIGC
jgi:hypothetical protein